MFSKSHSEEPKRRGLSPEVITAGKAAMHKIAAEIAAMPVLDPRWPQEIMHELNDV